MRLRDPRSGREYQLLRVQDARDEPVAAAGGLGRAFDTEGTYTPVQSYGAGGTGARSVSALRVVCTSRLVRGIAVAP